MFRTATIGQRITRLRLKAGLDHAKLSELTDITPDVLQKFEAGEGDITSTLMYRISVALDVPLTALLTSRPQTEVSFRHGSRMAAEEEMKDAVLERVGWIETLNAANVLGARVLRLPNSDHKAVAESIRHSLGVKDGPISDLSDRCEKVGLYVFELAFGAAGPMAAYAPLPGFGLGVAVVDSDTGKQVALFDLAHEVVHHFSTNAGPCDEAVVNRIAGEVVAPLHELLKYWNSASSDESGTLRVTSLAERYGVVPEVILRQLEGSVLDDLESVRNILRDSPPQTKHEKSNGWQSSGFKTAVLAACRSWCISEEVARYWLGPANRHLLDDITIDSRSAAEVLVGAAQDC